MVMSVILTVAHTKVMAQLAILWIVHQSAHVVLPHRLKIETVQVVPEQLKRTVHPQSGTIMKNVILHRGHAARRRVRAVLQMYAWTMFFKQTATSGTASGIVTTVLSEMGRVAGLLLWMGACIVRRRCAMRC